MYYTKYLSRWSSIIQTFNEHHHYLFGLAVNSGDPHSIIIFASQSFWQAHSLERAESLVYRRSDEDDNDDSKQWKIVKGLPEPSGTIISILAANPKIAGEFYAINNRGIFCSTNSAISWKMLDDIQWPKEYLSQHPRALAVRDG
jgi:hypothetical protein